MKAAGLPHCLIRGLKHTIRPRFIPQCRQFRISTPFANDSFIQAAPPIQGKPKDEAKKEGKEGEEEEEEETFFPARPVPTSASYFTGRPTYTDDLIELQEIQRRYTSLPRLPPQLVKRTAWKKLNQYREQVGDNVPAAKYTKIVDIMTDLNRIHPSLIPPDVSEAIGKYRRAINPFENKPNPIKIDKFGRALGVGRRKTSTARAWVVEGDGQFLVNGKTLVDAFARVHDRESAIWALKATDRIDKYNVWALVEGGGTTGQAEAMTMAVAKGLLAHEPLLKPALRRAGCITRDPRMVERKKHGHVKARKMPTWVKR